MLFFVAAFILHPCKRRWRPSICSVAASTMLGEREAVVSRFVLSPCFFPSKALQSDLLFVMRLRLSFMFLSISHCSAAALKELADLSGVAIDEEPLVDECFVPDTPGSLNFHVWAVEGFSMTFSVQFVCRSHCCSICHSSFFPLSLSLASPHMNDQGPVHASAMLSLLRQRNRRR